MDAITLLSLTFKDYYWKVQIYTNLLLSHKNKPNWNMSCKLLMLNKIKKWRWLVSKISKRVAILIKTGNGLMWKITKEFFNEYSDSLYCDNLHRQMKPQNQCFAVLPLWNLFAFQWTSNIRVSSGIHLYENIFFFFRKCNQGL